MVIVSHRSGDRSDWSNFGILDWTFCVSCVALALLAKLQNYFFELRLKWSDQKMRWWEKMEESGVGEEPTRHVCTWHCRRVYTYLFFIWKYMYIWCVFMCVYIYIYWSKSTCDQILQAKSVRSLLDECLQIQESAKQVYQKSLYLCHFVVVRLSW